MSTNVAKTARALPGDHTQRRELRLVIAVLAAVVVGVIVAGAIRWYDRREASSGPPPALAEPVRSQAHRHVPDGCEVVIRFDLERARRVPSFDAELGGVVDTLRREAAEDPRAKQAAELADRAGIDVARDIKDVVVCGLDLRGGQRRFVLVAGGDLRPGAIVAALGGSAREGKLERIDLGGRAALRVRSERNDTWWTFGQADDGALVFASDSKLYEAAVSSTDKFATYGLATDREASFVLGPAMLERASLMRSQPVADALAAVRVVRGTLSLSKPGAELRFAMRDQQKASQLEVVMRRQLLPLFVERSAGHESQVGEVEALRSAVTRVDGDEAIVELPWTSEGVEKAAKKVASLVVAASRSGGVGGGAPYRKER